MKDKIKTIKIKKIAATLVAISLLLPLGACSLPEKLSDFNKVIDVEQTEEEQEKWDNIISSITGDDRAEDENVNEDISDTADIHGAADIPETEGITNIMLVGVDSLEDVYTGRSDTMLLLSINKDSGKLVMTSFLRDIYVEIPGRGGDRLNAANVFGGTDLLKETIKNNFDITVDNTVVLNFFTVRDIVDELGGIDLNLTGDEIEIMNGYLVSQAETFGLEAGTDQMEVRDGTFHLNGNQTLAYARIRYIGTDFERTGRQRKIIMACAEKLKGMSALELASFAKNNVTKFKTDLGIMDFANLMYTLSGLQEYSITEFTIPMENSWENATVDGMSVLSVEFQKNSEEWYRLVTE